MMRRMALVIAYALAAAPAAHAMDLHVDTPVDGVDAQPGDGRCATAAGACTLRAAVQEANVTPAHDTIVLPAGRLTLSRPNLSPLPQQTADLELDTANGDLDILDALTVRGAGADRTIIDAGGLDRAFSVAVGVTAGFSDLEITHGDTTVNDKTDADISLGGAILNNGNATLERVALVGNHADGGGGLFTIPTTTLTISDSLVANNVAVEGGGLRVDSGATITNTTITGNRLEKRGIADSLPDEITGYGGGIDHRGGDNLTIVNSTITGNHADKAGGGLNSGQDYAPVVPAELWPFRVFLRNSIIFGNTADAGPGDCHVANMVIESRGHNLADDDSCFLTAPGDLPSTDPGLGALADNGGPTQTQALPAGSPAVDAGADCPAADQRGLPRAAACDIGAFERQPPPRLRVSRLGVTHGVVRFRVNRRCLATVRVTRHGARVAQRKRRVHRRARMHFRLRPGTYRASVTCRRGAQSTAPVARRFVVPHS